MHCEGILVVVIPGPFLNPGRKPAPASSLPPRWWSKRMSDHPRVPENQVFGRWAHGEMKDHGGDRGGCDML